MSPPYVIGDSSPFLKRVLIPFWIVRIIIMVVLIGLYAVLVAGLGVFKDDVQRLAAQYNTNMSYTAVLATSCVIMAIVLLCLILDIVCIVKRARRTLSPPFFLGVNITQSLFYTTNFVLTMIGAHNGALSIGINVVILLSFLGLLIYASVVFRQYRKGTLRGGAYVKANDPEAHKLVAQTGYPGAAAQTGYPQQQQQRQQQQPSYAPEYARPVSYNEQAAAAAPYAGQGYEPYRGQQVGYAQ